MAQMDTDYEYDDLDVETKPRVIAKKKGGWLGKIVALFLGIVIGIVGGIGGVVGAGHYIATQVKIKDVASAFTNLSGLPIPLSEYLSDKSSNETLEKLIESISTTATEISEGKGTLNDLNNISPCVKKALEQEGGIVEFLASYGVETTADELMKKILVKTVETEEPDEKYLTDFLMLKIDEIPFAKLIKTIGFEGSDMITALCYGIDGNSEPLTISGFMSKELDTRINLLPLDTVMDTPSDEVMRTLFYGPEHRYTVTLDGIEMNQVFYTYENGNFYDDNGDKLPLFKMSAGQNNTYLLTFTDETTQLVTLGEDGKYYASTAEQEPKAIKYKKTTIKDLKGDAANLINEITLESALEINEKSHTLLRSIAHGENGERRTIKDLRENGSKLIDEITLKTALEINEKSHTILKSIAEGKNGEKRTIKDLRENGSNLINSLELSDIIPITTDDKIIMYLLYGKEGVHYEIKDNAPKPLRKRVAIYNNDKVYNEYGELIEGAKLNGTESYTLGTTTYKLEKAENLKPIKVKVTEGATTDKKDATLYYVSLDGKDLYYEPTTIGDMQNTEVVSKLTSRLQLQDVMVIGEKDTLLKHLEEETINDLPAAINALTFDKVFGEHFTYRTCITAPTETEPGKYESYRIDENYQPINKNGEHVKYEYLVDINNQPIKYENKTSKTTTSKEADKALTGTWKYLLMNPTDGTIDHHLTIVEMEDMIGYMSQNIHAATVRALQRDGIVENLDETTLNTKIRSKIGSTEITIPQKDKNGNVRVDLLDGIEGDEDHIGDLTIEQLMLYITAILPKIPA